MMENFVIVVIDLDPDMLLGEFIAGKPKMQGLDCGNSQNGSRNDFCDLSEFPERVVAPFSKRDTMSKKK